MRQKYSKLAQLLAKLQQETISEGSQQQQQLGCVHVRPVLPLPMEYAG